MELAVVIFILSILFSILFGVYYSVSQVITLNSRGVGEKQEAILALEMMRLSLNRLYFQPDVDRLLFVGHQGEDSGKRLDRLTFAAVHPGSEQLGVAAVREVSFYVREEEGEEEGTLMRREESIVDDHPGEGGAHYPVLKNVESLTFRYTLDAVNWLDEWNSIKSKRIPRMIQIRLRVKIDGRTVLFETLATPGMYL